MCPESVLPGSPEEDGSVDIWETILPRTLTVGAAQLGPISKNEPRANVIERLHSLMLDARAAGCDIVVYPELALTTFFPRWYAEDPAECFSLLIVFCFGCSFSFSSLISCIRVTGRYHQGRAVV